MFKAVIGFHKMPKLTVGVEILHVGFHDVGTFERLARFIGAFPHSTIFEITHSDAIKRLPLAGLNDLVLEDRARLAID